MNSTTPAQLNQALTESLAEHLAAGDVRTVVAVVEKSVEEQQSPKTPKELADRAIAGEAEMIEFDVDAVSRSVSEALAELDLGDAIAGKATGATRRALTQLADDGPNDPKTLAAQIGRH